MPLPYSLLSISLPRISYLDSFLFQNHTTTEIYTLSLHDALPISEFRVIQDVGIILDTNPFSSTEQPELLEAGKDRKSTRLNSSHVAISYAVFCLKKKMITWVP